MMILWRLNEDEVKSLEERKFDSIPEVHIIRSVQQVPVSTPRLLS